MPVARARGAVAVSVFVVLLLSGCTAPAPTADVTMSPPTTSSATPSTSTTAAAEVTPFPSPTDWFEFITISSDEYGLAPDGWTTYDPVINWAKRYCESEGLSPCEGLGDRTALLCIETRDCHPAVLVPSTKELSPSPREEPSRNLRSSRYGARKATPTRSLRGRSETP